MEDIWFSMDNETEDWTEGRTPAWPPFEALAVRKDYPGQIAVVGVTDDDGGGYVDGRWVCAYMVAPDDMPMEEREALVRQLLDLWLIRYAQHTGKGEKR